MQNDIVFGGGELTSKSFLKCITIKWNKGLLGPQGFTVNASYWHDIT